jgi:hypothetical protein
MLIPASDLSVGAFGVATVFFFINVKTFNLIYHVVAFKPLMLWHSFVMTMYRFNSYPVMFWHPSSMAMFLCYSHLMLSVCLFDLNLAISVLLLYLLMLVIPGLSHPSHVATL